MMDMRKKKFQQLTKSFFFNCRKGQQNNRYFERDGLHTNKKVKKDKKVEILRTSIFVSKTFFKMILRFFRYNILLNGSLLVTIFNLIMWHKRFQLFFYFFYAAIPLGWILSVLCCSFYIYIPLLLRVYRHYIKNYTTELNMLRVSSDGLPPFCALNQPLMSSG